MRCEHEFSEREPGREEAPNDTTDGFSEYVCVRCDYYQIVQRQWNQMIIRRTWAMPSPSTFSIPPISDLLDRWLTGREVVIDPFAGDSQRGTIRNDLRDGVEASVFLDSLENVHADAVLFDPPYSPRQISEAYKRVGLVVGMKETQNGRLYKDVKDRLHNLLKPNGIAICCGWNSAGFGKVRGYQFEEILLVAHGGAHNDTIVTVERKI